MHPDDENNVTESYEKVNPTDIDWKMDTWFIFFSIHDTWVFKCSNQESVYLQVFCQ